MIFYSFTLLLFSVIFCFILFFQVLVYPSNVRNGFHHVEWTLSQIRNWLASSVSSTLPLHWHILKAGQILGQMFCSWIGVHISFLTACRVPLHTRDLRI